MLLQCSSRLLSVEILADKIAQDKQDKADNDNIEILVAKYRSGDIETIPDLLKLMGNTKTEKEKSAILNLLDIKHDASSTNADFAKEQAELKAKYLKHSINQKTQLPKDLTNIITGYLKEPIATFQAPHPHIQVNALVSLEGNKLAIGYEPDLDDEEYYKDDDGLISFDRFFELWKDDHVQIVEPIVIWDLTTNQTENNLKVPDEMEIPNSEGIISFAKLSDDRLIVGDFNGITSIWDIKKSSYVITLNMGPNPKAVTYIEKFDDDKKLILATDSYIEIFDLERNAVIKKLNLNSKSKYHVSMFIAKLDQDRLAMVYEYYEDEYNKSTIIDIYNLKTYELIKTLKIDNSGHLDTIASLNGNRLAVGYGLNESINIYDLQAYKLT